MPRIFVYLFVTLRINVVDSGFVVDLGVYSLPFNLRARAFDMARPPRDDLRVPTTELEGKGRRPWRSVWRGAGAKSRRGREMRAGRGAGWPRSAGSCTCG